MISLRHRSHDAELMDGPDVTQEDYAACMQDLASVNTLTLARRPTIAFIEKAMQNVPSSRPLTIVDVGFGAGDMLNAIDRMMKKRGREARLVGIDINLRSERVARQLSRPSVQIDFRTGDAFAWPEDEPIDIVISSLVTHHMEEPEIVRFLSWMEERARLGWFINDLHRHWLPYYSFRILAGVMNWHRFVRHDGPLSIARAFRCDDWSRLLDAAKLADRTRVSWWFPFRYCVERVKW